MRTNTLTDYRDTIETDLLEAKQLLRSGLGLALKKLNQVTNSAELLMRSSASAELKALEDLGEEAIDNIQSKLGELNYLTAEGDIKSVEDFERVTAPLSDLLATARRKLAKIDEIGQRELGEPQSSEIAKAWRDLHLHIEIVRFELSLTETKSVEEADKIRAAFENEMQSAAMNTGKESSLSKGIRAFFLAPKKPSSHDGDPR